MSSDKFIHPHNHHHNQDLKHSHYPKNSHWQCPPPTWHPGNHWSFCHYRLYLPFLEFQIYGIKQYCVLLYLAFTDNILRFIHILDYISSSLWISCSVFIRSPVDGYLCCLQFGVIMYNAAINIHLQVFVLIWHMLLFHWVNRSGLLACLEDMCWIFKETAKLFQTGCAILYFYQ